MPSTSKLWRFHFPQQTQLCTLDIVNRKIPAENELEPLITSVNLKPLREVFGFTQQWDQVFVCSFLCTKYYYVANVPRGMWLIRRRSKCPISHEWYNKIFGITQNTLNLTKTSTKILFNRVYLSSGNKMVVFWLELLFIEY